MATLGNKKRIVVKKSDLDKAIVSKNASLKASNSTLQKRLKDKEDELKKAQLKLDNINNDYRKFYDENDRLVKQMEEAESKLVILNEDCNNILSKSSKAISADSEAKKSYSTVSKKHAKLSNEVNKMEEAKKEHSSVKKELSSIKRIVAKESEDIAKLKSDKSKLLKQPRDAKSRTAKAMISHDMLKAELEVEGKSLQVKLDIMKKEITKEESAISKKLSDLNNELDIKNKDLDELNNIINQAKEDYIKQENKVNIAKNNVFEEEARIGIVKENFEKWKISALEEVAKMKLKGKLDSIDKAGLKEVLNG